MKLIRHILSHLFLITFLIAVVSVFYYRSFLFPEDIVEKVDGYVQDVYPPAVNFVSKRDYFWSIKGERIVSFDDLKVFEKEDKVDINKQPEVTAKVAAQDENAIKKSTDSVIEIEPKDTDFVASGYEHKQEEVVIAKKESPSPLVNQPVEAEESKETDKATHVVIQDKNTSSERELLFYARNAYSHGQLVQSEKFYIELTQLDNDTADIFGELGNVYYSQGKWDKAGQAYYEAAVRLIAEGKREQVSYLHRVIEGLNTEHADKLAQVMMRR